MPPARSRRPGLRDDAQRLVHLLEALGNMTVRQVLWRQAAEPDLTHAQSQVLHHLADHPGCHMGDVAKVFGVTLSAVTQIVDRLEEKKLVRRGVDPSDRRVHALSLTPAGRTLAEGLHVLRLRGVMPLLARLSPQDRDRVLTGLDTLLTAAARPGDNGARNGRRSSTPADPVRRLVVGVLLLGLAGLAGCGREDVAAAKSAPAAPRAFSITTARVEARDVDRVVETTGSLLAWQEVTLNTAVPGTVAKLLVDLGDRVNAGQVVAELDQREFVLAVRQADAALRAARDGLARAHARVEASRANLAQVRESRKTWEANLRRWKVATEEARLNLERSRVLVDRQLIAQRDLDSARTQFESTMAQYEAAQVEMGQYPQRVRVAEAELQSELSAVQVAEAEVSRREAEVGMAQKRRGDATLRAPIAGAIARRHVNPGESARENTAIFTIVRSDPLKYSGVVAEHAALEIRSGQTVRLEVDPVPGRVFTGRVTRVSPAVDVANRTVLLEAEVPNAEAMLRPGLFARGVVATRRDTGIAFAPEAAISYFAGITKAFVVTDGKAAERLVKAGRKQDGMVEVLEGLRPNEVVATSALAQLYDGAAVTAQAPKSR